MSVAINAHSAYNAHAVTGGERPVKSLLWKAVSNMTGPLGEGTCNHHGNLISFLIPPTTSAREELAEVKREY